MNYVCRPSLALGCPLWKCAVNGVKSGVCCTGCLSCWSLCCPGWVLLELLFLHCNIDLMGVDKIAKTFATAHLSTHSLTAGQPKAQRKHTKQKLWRRHTRVHTKASTHFQLQEHHTEHQRGRPPPKTDLFLISPLHECQQQKPSTESCNYFKVIAHIFA